MYVQCLLFMAVCVRGDQSDERIDWGGKNNNLLSEDFQRVGATIRYKRDGKSQLTGLSY